MKQLALDTYQITLEAKTEQIHVEYNETFINELNAASERYKNQLARASIRRMKDND